MKNSKRMFKLYGAFNLIITSNGRFCILLEGDLSAWERRIIIVRYEKPFNGQRIAEVEKYLLAKEASGILNWCVDGLKLLISDYHSPTWVWPATVSHRAPIYTDLPSDRER
jgi:phage/plasmid-associated DNA primase